MSLWFLSDGAVPQRGAHMSCVSHTEAVWREEFQKWFLCPRPNPIIGRFATEHTWVGFKWGYYISGYQDCSLLRAFLFFLGTVCAV